MSAVSITFTHNGSSAKFGNFNAGDSLVCSQAEADHFVKEAGCAKFSTVQTSARPAPAARAKRPAAIKAGPKAADSVPGAKARTEQSFDLMGNKV